ncbi:response regulator transcription factor [Actinoplanes sp. NPDC051470]|uniref:response regulator transcription factor n=1 Tax=unclassified Actinoplanes TaxID=2626549 RepID=UPI003428FF09
MKTGQRVLIVDDHPIVLHGLRMLLESEPWIEEITEARSVAEAIKEAVTRRVHLVIMDVRLPDGDGVEATRRIVRALPEAAVLVMTMDNDVDLVARAMEAGAHGFVLKDLDPADFLNSLRAVASGSVVIGPHAGVRVRAGTRSGPAGLPPPLDSLTTREIEILTMLAASGTTADIGRRLGVSQKTVRNQLSAIFVKIGVHDRVQAALLAQRLGLK